MGDNKKDSKPQIDSTNIFEDFTSDTKLGEEVKAQEKKAAKDIFYYIKFGAEFLKIVNLIIILGICLFLSYSFFQHREASDNYSFLSPVCKLFLGDVATEVSGCYGITSFKNKIDTELENEKKAQFDRINPLFEYVYELDNFSNSKSVTFLLDKTDSRLKPLSILSDFDTIKNKFEPIDKSKISCTDIVIRDDMTLSARCEAYSSDWDSDIASIENTKNSGTSISVASSFIDFFDNPDNSKFRVLDKQKSFNYINVSGNGIYTRKTNFDINLQYIETSNLAL